MRRLGRALGAFALGGGCMAAGITLLAVQPGGKGAPSSALADAAAASASCGGAVKSDLYFASREMHALPRRHGFRGMFAATLTPMHADGRINPDVIPAYCAMLVRDGCHGVFVNGTSGESMSLSVPERKELAAAWVRAASAYPDFAVIVQCGAASVADSCALAAHAESIGAAGVAAMAPAFFKPPSVAALAGMCAMVAQAAPRTPFLYYHYPAITGVDFSFRSIIRALAANVPTLAGAKFTGMDMGDLGIAATEYPNLALMGGHETMFLDTLAAGATSWISFSFSVFAPIYSHILAAAARGDWAEAARGQQKVREFFTLLDAHGGFTPSNLVSAGKRILSTRLGTPFGPPRAPLVDAFAAKGPGRLFDEAAEDFGFVGGVLPRSAFAPARAPPVPSWVTVAPPAAAAAAEHASASASEAPAAPPAAH